MADPSEVVAAVDWRTSASQDVLGCPGPCSTFPSVAAVVSHPYRTTLGAIGAGTFSGEEHSPRKTKMTRWKCSRIGTSCADAWKNVTVTSTVVGTIWTSTFEIVIQTTCAVVLATENLSERTVVVWALATWVPATASSHPVPG